MADINKKDPGVQVRSTREIKLKDKKDRNILALDFKTHFGFIPERMVIEKVRGRNNMIVVHAVLPEKELKKEKAVKKNVKGNQKDR